MSPAPLLAGLATGLSGGALAGVFGVGGGLVMVPLLGLILGLDQRQAQGATLAAMLLPTGLPAVLEYRRRGIRTSLRLVAILILGFLAGITGGAAVANGIPASALRWGFIAFLLIIAMHTWRRKEPALPDRGAEPLDFSRGAWRYGLPIGALAGVLSGLTGLGGAIVVIPLLAARFRMTQHEAQLTSLAMLLPPIGLPGVLVYARTGSGLPWRVIGGVALGFALGAFLGARVATRLRGARLKQAFAVLAVAMALLLVLRGH
ncbi:hypothetical protein GETHPA_13480 [Geothrix rubra]|uniref:Probable membrane transporter protein n=1 Tax=Geothrix rubra TaxID=2927977 RepID=A0ABQ5Q6U4_9BACT|nr:sulfite exporter TauE/SafE family protein [Geothrix rubra]GLH69815.1 hypothetical protein GETHPA_13480 [Geothrix rubra]